MEGSEHYRCETLHSLTPTRREPLRLKIIRCGMLHPGARKTSTVSRYTGEARSRRGGEKTRNTRRPSKGRHLPDWMSRRAVAYFSAARASPTHLTIETLLAPEVASDNYRVV